MDEELKRIVDDYLSLVESDENARRKNLWKTELTASLVASVGLSPRRVPKPRAEVGVPIIADTSVSIWREVFNFSVEDYYTNPRTWLVNHLKASIAHFKLGDDTYFSKSIGFFPGAGMESSLFGMPSVYDPMEEPAVGRHCVLQRREDLDGLSYPDFFRSGAMPLLHRVYEECSAALEGSGLQVLFSEITRGPYGVAFHIRGFTDLAIDTIDDPEWVQRLMRFLTDCHKKWYQDRSSFLGEPIPLGLLYNDEIDMNIIPPYIYDQFIFSYEKELADFHGGIAYWHSCGKITPILHQIRQLPNIQMIKISSWNNYGEATQTCPDIPLEICVGAIDHIQMADERKMADKVSEILATCEETGVDAFIIRSEPLQRVSENVDNDLSKIQQWISTARRLTEQ